jgi:hypothetical protein
VLLVRVAYNQVVSVAPDWLARDRIALDWLARDRMTRIPVLLEVIKDDDCSTTNSMSIGGACTMYSTKPSFHQ